MKLANFIFLVFLVSSCIEPQSYQNKDQVVASMAASLEQKFPQVNHLGVQEYLDLLQKQELVELVDVRTQQERSVSYIPGSITVDQLMTMKKNFGPFHIIFYSTLGQRSSEYIQSIDPGRYQKVSSLKGGILGWVHAGQKVINDQGEAKKIHVYQEAWNLVPKGYEGVTKP